MAKKQYVVVSNVHMGKTPYDVIDGKKTPWNHLTGGQVFEAEEDAMEKLLRVGAIKPYSGKSAKEPEPVEMPVVEESVKRGRR